MSLSVLTRGGGFVPTASILVTGLSENDIVTATKDGVTKNGVWVTKPNPNFHALPDAYTELEYIESTGTQYIDTGLKPAQVDSVSAVFMKATDSAEQSTVFGCGASGNVRWAPLAYWGSGEGNNGVCSIMSNAWNFTKIIARDSFVSAEADCVSGSPSTIKIDGVTYTGDITSSPNTNIGMFAFSSDGGNQKIWTQPLRIKEAKMMFDGAVLRHYIPAKRNSDGVFGLYDLANNVFYQNTGTDAFIAGAEVPQDIGCHEITKIKDFGMWTVTATNGEQTTTQYVLVDVITEFVIEMHFKLWLYREGDECEDVTGGWEGYNINGTGTFQKKDDHLYLGINGSYIGAAFSTNKAVSVYGYSKLFMELEAAGAASGVGRIGLWTSKPADRAGTGLHSGIMVTSTGTKTVISVDVIYTPSDLYAALLIASSTASENNHCRLYRMWLE